MNNYKIFIAYFSDNEYYAQLYDEHTHTKQILTQFIIDNDTISLK